jgi:hypothetical protein
MRKVQLSNHSFILKRVLVLFVLGLFSIAFIYLQAESGIKSDFIQLSYDKHNSILLIRTVESAKYIKKIDLDMRQDTLAVRKISRKPVPFSGVKHIWQMSECAVKLQPNVESVMLGSRLYKLSELNEYSHEKLLEQSYSVITVFPKKFPCVIQ